MAQDNEELIAEARRKALRNGEEDPVVVAQRYLNIYRQMHIFSPERKEAFNKMLLDLPTEITSIFSALPGGLMLQDYLSDLAEKHGIARAPVNKAEPPSANIDDPLPQSVPQPVAAPASQAQVQFVPSGNVDLSLGKDFAQQLAGAFDNVLNRQSELQRASMEKISADLSKNQVALAQYINQSREAQQQNFNALINTLSQKNVSASSETASPAPSDGVIQELINNQKEISLRLSKMESTTLSDGSNNQELVNMLVKSNAEMLASMKTSSTSVSTSSANAEELLKLIEQSQAQLIEGVVGRILQSNVLNSNQSAASNNNANNIQINTPDTSAQTLMLVNKIADLQVANEKNMEEAITRLISAQKEIYENISAAQSKEIANAIVNGLQSASLTFNNYAPSGSYVPATPAVASPVDSAESFVEPKEEDYISSSTEQNDVQEVVDDNSGVVNDVAVEATIPKKKKKKKKKEKKSNEAPSGEIWHAAADENPAPTNEEFFNPEEEFVAPSVPEEPVDSNDSWSVEPLEEENVPQIDNSFSFENQESQSDLDENISAKEDSQNTHTFDDSADDSDLTELKIDDLPKDYSDIATQEGVSWGFDEESDADSAADNNKADDKKQDFSNDDVQYEEVEMIGNNSNIYIDDLSRQSVNDDLSPIIYNQREVHLHVIPQIFDDVDNDKDPYLK